MHKDSSSQFPTSPSLQPLPSVRTKIWQIVSLTLTVGGLALMGWGSWIFMQNQIEASKPPPVRILEVNIEDLVLTSTQTNTATPESVLQPETALGQESVMFSELTAVGVPSLADNPLPVVEKEKPTQIEKKITSQKVESLAIAETALETRSSQAPVPALESLVGTTPSLTDNPLPVTEVSEPLLETDEVTGPPPATSPPTRIVAESINLDADVIEVGWEQVIQNGKPANVWTVADFAAGWHKNSALPGQQGNVVFSGHHNIKGEVFRYLVDLEPGTVITLYVGDQPYQYAVTDKFIVKDKGEPEAVRRENAKWIGPFNDQRLTLVTCWPYNNNTHRLIVIGHPVGDA